VDKYLQTFQWNKVKYRADKPIAELFDMLQKELAAVDNDVKSKFNQYSSTKTSLATLQRSHTGNLSQKSLTTVLNPETLLRDDDSEYLQQHLIAVPNNAVKDFLKSYESVSPMVVPRSAQLLAKDDEFQLYAVTTFKKHASEFLHKCRENRWVPRDMKFTDGGRAAEEQEIAKLEKDERRVWGEALRLGRTGYSDAVMCWIHVLTLRVFVETVLRYGLPLAFVCGLVKVRGNPRARLWTVLPRNSRLSAKGYANDHDRPTASEPRKQRMHSTPDLQSLVGTLLAETRREGRKRTMVVCSKI
jgi:V-type H+-transporting ATPase subunit C